MVHSIYSSTHLSWGHANPFQTRTNQGHSPVRGLSEQEDATINDDPVRIARDHWVARPTYISDSSEIIDSIDVDMVDDDSVAEIYLILDTNILIHHLDVLKQALSLVGADPIRLNMVMLIPGIVVSELDYQKKSTRNIANESRKASDWLAREIGNSGGRVKGQAYTQTMLPSGDWRQRSGVSFIVNPHRDVLLCTSDNNLAVQASANGATPALFAYIDCTSITY
ncbi:hypothetical protein K439DRAFT_894135 [Ramaria rubella]|nr:hypothetical protein K439DRAFT_894135 [Ramaria rubella]